MRPVKLKIPMKEYQDLHNKAFNKEAKKVQVDRESLVKLLQDYQSFLASVEYETPEGRE